MEVDIKKIEDLSINAWPSHQIQFYDNWVLRFSYFYTHRTNCVEQLGRSLLPLDEKIEHCESIYRKWNTPCIFKISPVGEVLLDQELERRGYEIQHHTTVMTCSLMDPEVQTVPDGTVSVKIEDTVTRNWMDGLFLLKKTVNPTHIRVVPSMYDAIPMDKISVSIIENGTIVGTGLGILDREYVGIYAIHVAEHCRRRDYASEIIRTIFREAKQRGAEKAYLQVVTDNAPARMLYRRLGFREAYCYWFRVSRNLCTD